MKTAIEMAREVLDRMAPDDHCREPYWTATNEELERFAELVRANEAAKYKWDIHSCGPTCDKAACVATRKAVAAEREACAKVCEEQYEYYGHDHVFAAAIRARGNT